ncbi:MAG: glycosyltransferase [Verrucomicrobiota bacterium]
MPRLLSNFIGLLSSLGERCLAYLPKIELAAGAQPPAGGAAFKGAALVEDDSTKGLTFQFQRVPSRPWVFLYGRLGRMAKARFVDVHFEGGREPETFRIPLNRNGTLSEILPLAPDVAAVRFEFSVEHASLAFQELRVVEILEFERALRLLDRVWRFDAESLLEIPIWGRLSQLDRLYAQVRVRRLDRLSWNLYELFINAVEAPQIGKSSSRRDSDALPKAHSVPMNFEIHLSEGNPESRLRTMESLYAQTYSNWRLGGKGDASSGHSVWIVPVRSGDVLRSDALQQIVWVAEADAEAAVIYSDHDFMGPDGQRHTPAFKPDWNVDLFYTHNYLADLCVFRADICCWQKVEGSALLDESVRYELILHVADSVPRRIRHISQVLCHRSESMNLSPTLGLEAQPDTLQRHLRPCGAVVEAGVLTRTSSVRWPLPKTAPLVSLIIATRDQCKVLEACVRSIQAKTDYPAWELIVLDNESSEPATLALFKELSADSRIRVIPYQKAFNYAALQNFGVRHSRGEVVVFLNNDVEVLSASWLGDMVRHALRADVGAVGARLLYTDGCIQHAGVVLGIGGVAGHVHRFFAGDSPGYCGRIQLTQELSAVTAACLAVRKSAFEVVGGFDEKHLKVALNDVDLCLKLKAHGLRNIYEPAVLLYHHESLSRGPDDTPRKRRIFSRERRKMLSRWKAKLKRDPHYSENLTLHSEDCGLRVEGV